MAPDAPTPAEDGSEPAPDHAAESHGMTPIEGLRAGFATIAREIGLRAANRNPVSYYAVSADTSEYEPGRIALVMTYDPISPEAAVEQDEFLVRVEGGEVVEACVYRGTEITPLPTGPLDEILLTDLLGLATEFAAEALKKR
jgi:hypothetical protein